MDVFILNTLVGERLVKILFYLGHPAHFHLFKNVIIRLQKKRNEILILIKKKDILEDLLINSNLNYVNILPEGRKNSKLGILVGMLKRDLRLFTFCLKEKPSLLIGTSAEIGHVGSLLKIPSINVNEDDASVIYTFAKISYPFNNFVLSPTVCNNLQWNKKTINYKSYHELAYLHPNNFIPRKDIVKKYISLDRPYFVIRFAKLNAHHDKGISGISNDFAHKIINVLSEKGNVFITAERKLSESLEKYRIDINPIDMHHILAFSQLYIGDSQTMAAEAGVLGTPFIRFNDFVGKIGYLNELENNYQLGFGYKTNEVTKMLDKIKELLEIKDLKKVWKNKREKMLKDKIDTASFFSWFIENYPKSARIMKKNPDYQNRFK